MIVRRSPDTNCRLQTIALVFILLLAVVVLPITAAAGEVGELALEFYPVRPESMVGEQVTIKAELNAGAAKNLRIDGTLITPLMETRPVSFTCRSLEFGETSSLLIGIFTPERPGRYEIDVVVRGQATGRDVSLRKRMDFQIRRGKQIGLSGGGDAVDCGAVSPGGTANIAVLPQFNTQRGQTIDAYVDLLQSSGGAEITATSITVTPPSLSRTDLPAAISISIAVPEDQPAGDYTGNLSLETEFDTCTIPVFLTVQPPDLSITPEVISFGRIQRGNSGWSTLIISLGGNGRQTVKISLQPWVISGSGRGPGFFVEGLTRTFELHGGASEAIKVNVRVPDDAAVGNYRSSLVVETPLLQTSVPVTATVTAPPLPMARILAIALAALTALLAVLLAWDLYRTFTGHRSSPLRRYLLASALIHAVALLFCTILSVEPTSEMIDRRVAVKAVLIAGDSGLPGEHGAESADFMKELAQLGEREHDVDLAMAESNQEAQKTEAEGKLDETEAKIDLEPVMPERTVELIEENRQTPRPQELPSEQPDIAEAGPEQKHAEERRAAAQARDVDLNVPDAPQLDSRKATRDTEAVELEPRKLAPEKQDLTTRARPEQRKADLPAEIVAPPPPAEAVLPVTAQVKQKAAPEASPVEPENRIALAAAASKRILSKPQAAPVEIDAVPVRSTPLPRTEVPLVAAPPPLRAAKLQQVALPQPKVSLPPMAKAARPQEVKQAAAPEPERPAEPEPLAVDLAMAGPAKAALPGSRRSTVPVGLPEPKTVRHALPASTAAQAALPAPVGTAAGQGAGTAGLGHQVSAGKVVIGTARYTGDWDCDKTAMPNLAYQMERRVGLAVETESLTVPLSSPDIFKCAFVFLSGHSDFALQASEIQQLRRYLDAGGALWINDSTHEGDTTFDAAARRELARLLPDARLEPMPMNHPLFSACYDLTGGYKGYEIPPGDKYRENRLHGIRVKDRWAVIYTRNDYGDGLEIDPNTHPLMKSLTNLSPAEMQEGAVRMGMNFAFYILHSAREADDAEKLKLADMRRSAAAVPEMEERSRQLVAGKQSQPIFQVLEPQEQWMVPADWSRDATAIALNGERLTLNITRGQDGKNVVNRTVQGDLTGCRFLVVQVHSQMQSGARLAIGISTGENWSYHESAPQYIRPGNNPDVVFDLAAETFKTQATNWEYRSAVENASKVRTIHLLLYPISSGTIAIDNIKVIR